jgi:hypothetical protein
MFILKKRNFTRDIAIQYRVQTSFVLFLLQ